MLDMKVSRQHLNAVTSATYERTAHELGKSREPATCAAVCRRLNRVIEDELTAMVQSGATVACTAGCDYCCHLRVEVFHHEAVALLEHLRTRMAPAEAAAVERRIVENAQRVDAMTVAQHRAAVVPCAFLANGRCCAYEVRPAACAAYHSLSRERCEHSFRHPSDIGTPRNARPALLELQVFGAAVIEATQAGCRSAGLAGEQSELHQALRSLLASDASP
jgi:Fe-S-cluster containining protein